MSATIAVAASPPKAVASASEPGAAARLRVFADRVRAIAAWRRIIARRSSGDVADEVDRSTELVGDAQQLIEAVRGAQEALRVGDIAAAGATRHAQGSVCGDVGSSGSRAVVRRWRSRGGVDLVGYA
jgi:hypothetical protein